MTAAPLRQVGFASAGGGLFPQVLPNTVRRVPFATHHLESGFGVHQLDKARLMGRTISILDVGKAVQDE